MDPQQTLRKSNPESCFIENKSDVWLNEKFELHLTGENRLSLVRMTGYKERRVPFEINLYSESPA